MFKVIIKHAPTSMRYPWWYFSDAVRQLLEELYIPHPEKKVHTFNPMSNPVAEINGWYWKNARHNGWCWAVPYSHWEAPSLIQQCWYNGWPQSHTSINIITVERLRGTMFYWLWYKHNSYSNAYMKYCRNHTNSTPYTIPGKPPQLLYKQCPTLVPSRYLYRGTYDTILPGTAVSPYTKRSTPRMPKYLLSL